MSPLPDGSERHQPRLEMLLIDERRAVLPEGSNLVGLLFELERSRSAAAIDRVVARLSDALAGPEAPGLRRAFTTFLRESLLPARFPGSAIPAIRDLEEVRPMLKETVKGWTREWERQGLKRGLQQGRREGEAALLARLLERRFGPLSAGDHARLETADAETLLLWGDRVLSAATLREVFGD